MDETNKKLELLTIEEVRKLLKISRSKAYLLTKDKTFPVIKIGKCIRVDKNMLLNWLKQKEI